VIKGNFSFSGIIVQIVLLDIVFSLDSVITAVGMAQQTGVMIAAVVLALILMLLASGVISAYIHKHPSLKMLALSFLMMVGVTLIAEGLEFHIPKGYIYFAMGFSGMVKPSIFPGTENGREGAVTAVIFFCVNHFRVDDSFKILWYLSQV
jgi:predicted tellurium resistance membrane protein TerC